ncbi:MAG: PQQ-binding-like beta-propeller repeat protein [Burkholderiales bacterium]|nr:PQQ-binding-like beta-propeller repeat protein [Burkholderiales bacterium]
MAAKFRLSYFMILVFLALLYVPPANALRIDATSDWPMYNKTFQGQRFSALDQINRQNVASLREVCRIKIARGGSFHTGPIVVDGMMVVTTARLTTAFDPTNCTMLWRHVYTPEEDEVWGANRGIGHEGGRLFRGTSDGRFLALDAKTGKQLWKIKAANPKRGEYLSAAPIVWSGLVFTGLTGGDLGIKGRMMAFDADTGKEVWRFNTIPLPHEPGAETWKIPETLKTGGGATWTSFALDAARGEIFIPVGNPAPDFAPSYRPGDNLYTDSVVVLDARTGKLKWWYQLIPHDGHDLDLAAPPILYRQRGGADVVALAGKDGFVHVVDRQTHRLIFKTAVTTIKNSGAVPTPEGVHVCPGVFGGTTWNSPGYEPSLNALFVGAVDWCTTIKSAKVRYVEGELFLGGSIKQDKEGKGWVTSLDADSGKINWQYHADGPVVAAMTPTAGGLLFAGDLAGHFLAFDSKTGQVLVKVNTGGAVAGGIVTYAVKGKQYVATTSGNVSRGTFGALGVPTIIVMSLSAAPNAAPIVVDASVEEPAFSFEHSAPTSKWSRIVNKLGSWFDGMRSSVRNWRLAGLGRETKQSASAQVGNPMHGKTLFTLNCAGCHGNDGSGLVGPSLKNLSGRMSFMQAVDIVKNPKSPMPQLYPATLSEQEITDIVAYLHAL